MAAKAISRWVTQHQNRAMYEKLQVKHAFTLLLFNQQQSHLEQLMTDNENLID